MKPTFSDRNIIQARWLIKVRWLIAIGTIISVFVVYLLKIVDLNFFWLFIVSASLFVLNLIYTLELNRIQKKTEEVQEKLALRNIHWQIAIDFIVLTLLLHFSGGIENPCIIFYVFHMIIGSIILPVRGAIFHALLAITLFTTMSTLEYLGIISHYSLNEFTLSLVRSAPGYLFFALAVFALTSLLLVYFTVTLAERMRYTRSELKKSNKHLLNQDTIKNEYVYRVTHNIKSDLSTISSCLAVVNQKILDPQDPKNSEFVEKASNRTKRLMNFVDDLLNLTNMRLSNRFQPKEFDISEVVLTVYNQLQPIASDKAIVYLLDKPNKPVLMEGIKTSIQEAIQNLVSNAIKYTPEGGKVKTILRSMKSSVAISVVDTGNGIPQDELPHIFEEFFRASNVNNQEGSGVGLALVKAIVERHKGKIKVQSELSKGSVFTLLFNEKLTL
jgi:signal transduction histidine kinase